MLSLYFKCWVFHSFEINITNIVPLLHNVIGVRILSVLHQAFTSYYNYYLFL